ncbi:16905_t:CDS:2, partial [Entrophospora sp. SA101]
MLPIELDILKKVHHKYITSLHDLYETKDGVFIITDLASGGELFNQLLLKGSYTEEDAANLMKQLLEGVQYLHDLDIVHRDLKPENLLFKDKSDEADIMITDFGLSKILKSEDDVLLTACGTPGYIAPEVLLQAGYGKPIDIWSIGVIMYTMLCGYTPFWGEDQAALFESIMSGEYEYEEEYWSEISDLGHSLCILFVRWKNYEKYYNRLTAIRLVTKPKISDNGDIDKAYYFSDYVSSTSGIVAFLIFVTKPKISDNGDIDKAYYFSDYVSSTSGIVAFLIFGTTKSAVFFLPCCYYSPPDEIL